MLSTVRLSVLDSPTCRSSAMFVVWNILSPFGSSFSQWRFTYSDICILAPRIYTYIRILNLVLPETCSIHLSRAVYYTEKSQERKLSIS